MAILKNQEIHFVRLNPNRPEKNMFDPTKFSWSIQCRSTDKAQIAEWKALGLKPKVVREDKDDEESKVLYQQVSFRKNSKRMDPKTKQQTDNTPVEVVNGKGEPIDSGTIGSGSFEPQDFCSHYTRRTRNLYKSIDSRITFRCR